MLPGMVGFRINQSIAPPVTVKSSGSLQKASPGLATNSATIPTGVITGTGILVLGIYLPGSAASTVTINSITYNAKTPTLAVTNYVQNAVGESTRLALYAIAVTPADDNQILTVAANQVVRGYCYTYSYIENAVSATADDSDTAASANPNTVSITAIDNSVIIGVNAGSAASTTWTNLTEDLDINVGGSASHGCSLAHNNYTTGQTVSVSAAKTANYVPVLVAGSFH